MIPNIFGKNDDYIIVLPISFWAYYLWHSKFTVLSFLFLSLGLFSLIARVSISQLKNRIEKKEIKNTSDVANFVLRRPLTKIAISMGSAYLYFTAVYGFFLHKDIYMYWIWISMAVGILYLMLHFFTDEEYRRKILEIAYSVKEKLLKRA